jgi:hypothetical protein
MTKVERMFGVVEDWQRSGMGKHRYAEQASIKYGTLQYWCKRYREEQAPTSPKPSFVSLPLPAPSASEAPYPPQQVHLFCELVMR